jgi:hypothetical protein
MVSANDRITINGATGEISSGISFSNYFTGMIMSGGLGWIGICIVSVFAAALTILIPVALVFMIISPFRSKPPGVKRGFSGSYPHFIFCLFIVAAMALFLLASEYANETAAYEYSPWVILLMAMYIAGTVLYPFAHRSFYSDSIRANRKRQTAEEISSTNTFSYTKTTWSDGTTTSDYGTQLIGRNLGLLLVWIIKMLFAPFIVYFAMIQNYLIDPHPKVQASSSPSQSGAPAKQPQVAPMPLKDFNVGQVVFALWQADGLYYPGMIEGKNSNMYDIKFHDEETATLSASYIADVAYALDSMSLQANWDNQGSYYDCKVAEVLDDGTIRVRYDDGVYENANLGQFRAMR